MLAFVVMEHFKRSVKTAYYSVNLLIPWVYFLFYFFRAHKNHHCLWASKNPSNGYTEIITVFKYEHTVYACTTIQHRNTIHMKIVCLRH